MMARLDPVYIRDRNELQLMRQTRDAHEPFELFAVSIFSWIGGGHAN